MKTKRKYSKRCKNARKKCKTVKNRKCKTRKCYFMKGG